MTRGAGVSGEQTRSWGAVWGDFNRDRRPDLFVNRHWNDPWLYRKTTSIFRRVREEFVHLPGYRPGPDPDVVDRHGCAWGEANGDRRPDLYCGVGAGSGRLWGSNQLVMRKDGRFVDRGRRFRVEDRFGRARSVNWIDVEGDGDLDIFVANGLRKSYPNVLLRNVRGRFRRADAGLRRHKRSLSSSWADWDRDGDPDLLLLQGGVTGRGRWPAIAYENVGGRFRQIDLGPVTGRPWKSAAWGDYDGDGWPDLHLVRARRARVLRNLGGRFALVHDLPLRSGRTSAWIDIHNDADLDLFVVQGATGTPIEPGRNEPDFVLIQHEGGFRRVRDAAIRGPRTGNGDAVAVSDYDRDGKLDVLVTNGHNPSGWAGRTTLLRNRTRGGRWIAVDLKGGRWNPLGIGAEIEVTTGMGGYRRQITDGVTYRAQSEVAHVHLGIGRARRARVKITWPRGRTDCLVIRAGERRSIARGSRPCPDTDGGTEINR